MTGFKIIQIRKDINDYDRRNENKVAQADQEHNFASFSFSCKKDFSK